MTTAPRSGRDHGGVDRMRAVFPRRLRSDDGAVLPALIALMAMTLAGGIALAFVGGASALRAEAQTGADAAALAAAADIRDQLLGMDAAATDCLGADDVSARRAAARYAQRNSTHLTSYERTGCDVTVGVATDDRLDGGPADLDIDDPAAARARARIEPGDTPAFPGTGSWEQVPLAPGEGGPIYEALVAEANRIDAAGFPYRYGAGHVTPAPANGPAYDCSSSVSRLLQAVGLLETTITSAIYSQSFEPGVDPDGILTIWAYPGHVFVTIGGRGWGTGGSNPGGGPGWLPYNSPYHGLFQPRHIPGLADADFDPSEIGDLGTTFVGPAAFGFELEVRLVEL